MLNYVNVQYFHCTCAPVVSDVHTAAGTAVPVGWKVQPGSVLGTSTALRILSTWRLVDGRCDRCLTSAWHPLTAHLASEG